MPRLHDRRIRRTILAGPRPFRLAALAAAAITAVLPACSTAPEGGETGTAGGPRFELRPALPWAGDPRELPILDGRTGRVMSWSELVERAASSDVVIMGELHDDGPGHKLQAVLAEDVAAAVGRVHVAVEMLERDEQPLVDDWMEGLIDDEAFMEMTESASWAGDGSWVAWYQPVLEAAKDSGGRVIAANAPRRYVRLARTLGYERLAEMPPPRAGYITIPDELPEDPYWERFLGFMTSGGRAPIAAEDVDDAARERARNTFRSQYLWDTTMGASLAMTRNAIEAGEVEPAPVLLLVGQFHSDFEGGTVTEFRKRRPDDSVLVVSVQRGGPADALVEEDEDRADVVVRTPANP